jgi:hypothetical protein
MSFDFSYSWAQNLSNVKCQDQDGIKKKYTARNQSNEVWMYFYTPNITNNKRKNFYTSIENKDDNMIPKRS